MATELLFQHGTVLNRWARMPIAQGDDGIHQTIGAMAAMVLWASQTPQVRRVAAKLDRTSDFDSSLWMFLRHGMRFRADPPGSEMLQSPIMLLGQIKPGAKAVGDCDDRAMLGASILKAAGRYPVLVTCGLFAKGRFQHVYYGRMINPNGTLTRDNVIPSDPQEGVPLGRWTRGQRERIFLV